MTSVATRRQLAGILLLSLLLACSEDDGPTTTEQRCTEDASPRLYFSSFDESRVAYIDPGSGESPVTVADGAIGVGAIALDRVAGRIYWATSREVGPTDREGEIWRANLDGTEAERIVDTVESPRGMDIDRPQERPQHPAQERPVNRQPVA
ncbi:MAG: hypothetical protein DHS20C19_22440 [Acidimicrobiales bacterium]|nr:MAG: hypothetical protein DHS20C19_22440 [Acidimicrobiales bacterium]